MYNVQGLRERHKQANQFKNFNNRGGFLFAHFMNPRDLPDGVFFWRMCPPDQQKNPAPSSISMTSTGKVEVARDAKDNIEFLRAECLDMMDPDIKYLTDYTDSILQSIADGETAGQINRSMWSDDLNRAIGKLSAWVRYAIPSLWWLNSTPYVKKIDNGDGTFRERNAFHYSASELSSVPLGVIFQPDQETVLDRLFQFYDDLVYPKDDKGNLIPGSPPVCDRFQGRMLKLQKQGTKYQLDMALTPTAMPEEYVTKFLGKDYPNLVKMRDKLRKTSAEVIRGIQNSWWKPEIEALGINLALPTREPGAPNISTQGFDPSAGFGAPTASAQPAPTQTPVSPTPAPGGFGLNLGLNLGLGGGGNSVQLG